MELAVPNTHKSTDDLSSDKPATKDEGTLISDQKNQATESQAASDPNLLSESESKIRRAPQSEGLTLFGGDVPAVSHKQKLAAALPQLVLVDVDTVVSDSRAEKHLRECKIDTVFTPSSGLLTIESLREAALQEPVHIISHDGRWLCIAGEGLLAEAKTILKPPRFLPMLLRKETKKDALLRIAIVEQLIQPARHQMEHGFFKARIPVILRCAQLVPALFAQRLRDDQWATILRRSLRWFAGAKKSSQKADPADGK